MDGLAALREFPASCILFFIGNCSFAEKDLHFPHQRVIRKGEQEYDHTGTGK